MQQIRQWVFVVSMLCFTVVAQAALPLSDSAGNKLPTLSPMLKNVSPAVVNIATFSKRRDQNPLLNDPFFRRFFNIPDQQQMPKQAPKKRQQRLLHTLKEKLKKLRRP